MGFISTLPDAPKEEKKKEPGILSLHTPDLLRQIESADATTASSMARAVRAIDGRHRRADQLTAPLYRRREAEVMAGEKKTLAAYEWMKKTHPELAKRKRVSGREYELLMEGYATYLANEYKKAQIDYKRAQTLKARRQPTEKPAGSLRALAARGLTPEAGRERMAALTRGERGFKEQQATTAFGRKEALAETTFGRRQTLAETAHRRTLKRDAAKAALKPAVKDERFGVVIAAARKVTRTGVEREGKITFDEWMRKEYMPVARSLTPEQRGQVVEALGTRLPRQEELRARLVVPKTITGRVWDTHPKHEDFEAAYETLEVVIEGLRLHGAPEPVLDEVRNIFTEDLRRARREMTGGK